MAHKCQDCVFVADRKLLFLYHITREIKDKVSYKPKFVGKFTMTQWVGHSSFYLFTCKECKGVTVDYPHGYSRGCMYLRCDHCSLQLILSPRKFREIYKRDDLYVPQSFSLAAVLKLLLLKA